MEKKKRYYDLMYLKNEKWVHVCRFYIDQNGRIDASALYGMNYFLNNLEQKVKMVYGIEE